MAKMEYTAECVCGGQIKASFKKPDRLQHSIARPTCSNCHSKFMFTFYVEYRDGKKMIERDFEVTNATEKLRNALLAKKEELREASA